MNNENIECNKIKSFKGEFEDTKITSVHGIFGHFENFISTEFRFPESGTIIIGNKKFTNKRFGELLEILNQQYFPEDYLQV